MNNEENGMGEFADMTIDYLLPDEEFDGPEYEYNKPPNRQPRTIVCRYCGMDGLTWGKVWNPYTKKNNWRLFKDGVGHVCKYKNK